MRNFTTFKKKWILRSIVWIVPMLMVLTACGGGSSGGGTAPPPGNNAPVASAGSITTNEDTAANGTLSATDADGDSMTFSIVAQPANGTVAIADPATGAFVYTPAANYNGADSFTFKASDGTADSATTTVSVTVTPVNDGPTNVDAGLAQTVEEGVIVNLSGTGDDPEDGAGVTFSWTQTAGTPTVTIQNDDTATPSFTAPVVTDITDLTFQLTVTDTQGLSATDTVVVTITNAAYLLKPTTNVSPANTVDLTAMGNLDWIQMGRTGTAVVRKDTATPLIGAPAVIANGNGSPVANQFTDAWVGYTWSDGAGGDVQATPTTSGVYYNMANDVDRVGQGYSMQIQADTLPRTLTLYLGGFQAEGTLTATLSDDPTNPQAVVLTEENNDTEGFSRAVTFTFKAMTAGATLDIEYVLTDDFGTNSNLTFQAATLASVAAPAISPAGGVITNSAQVTLSAVTPGSEIRYTLDGSVPDTNSALYTAPFTVDGTTGSAVRAKAFLNSKESAVAAADFTVNASADTILTATVGLPVSDNTLSPETQVDLSVEGTVDWMHQGQDGSGDVDRKDGVTPQIGNLTKIGAPGGPSRMDDAPVFYLWTGGTGGDETDGTTTGVFYSMPFDGDRTGQGFMTTAEATTTLRTLKLYVGGYQALGQLTATLGSQTATVTLGNQFGAFTRVVTLTFQAPAADSVQIEYTMIDDYDTDSNLTFQAATLAE